MVERQAYTLVVPGSSPGMPTNTRLILGLNLTRPTKTKRPETIPWWFVARHLAFANTILAKAVLPFAAALARSSRFEPWFAHHSRQTEYTSMIDGSSPSGPTMLRKAALGSIPWWFGTHQDSKVGYNYFIMKLAPTKAMDQ